MTRQYVIELTLNVGVFRIKGQANLEFTVDREKCAMWNINVGAARPDTGYGSLSIAARESDCR